LFLDKKRSNRVEKLKINTSHGISIFNFFMVKNDIISTISRVNKGTFTIQNKKKLENRQDYIYIYAYKSNLLGKMKLNG